MPDHLLESVKRLAAAPDEQTAYVRQLGSYPSLDELALEFDDALRAPQPGDRPQDWVDAVGQLDAKLSAMSGQAKAALWRAEALTSTEWAEVRALAQQALSAW